MTCQEYFNKWLARQRLTVRTSTYESLCCYVNVHIVPFFYGRDLQDLTVQDIRTYIDEKLKSGRSDQKGALSLVTVRKHLSILKQALNEAVVLGYIEHNPCTSIKLARRKSVSAERMVFLSVEEAQAMLLAIKGSQYYTASILFDMGWQLEDVKDWLGHADIETTSNIYLHYSADRKKLLARDLIGKFKI